MVSAPPRPWLFRCVVLMAALVFGVASLATVVTPGVPAAAAQPVAGPDTAPTGSRASSADSADDPYAVAAATTGDVHPMGAARFHGSLADTGIEERVADIAATRTGRGYWIVTEDGHVYAYGDARFFGDLRGVGLNQPIVAIAPHPRGFGYWLAAADGGVFTFGPRAGFYGSMGAIPLVSPVVDIVSTTTGRGYLMAAADGGVFNFGDAPFLGSMGGRPLDAPVSTVIRSSSGRGYTLFADDGGVFTFGDAPFLGSLGRTGQPHRIVAGDAAGDGRGYWIVSERGTVTSFGAVANHGSVAASGEEPVVGIAARPNGDGYWLATTPGRPSVGPALPAGSGSGRRVVYSNSSQRVWLVEHGEWVVDSWLVSGRPGVPQPGTYGVFSKSRHAWAGHGGITMEYMVRFAHGRTLAIGFHSIPVRSDGSTLQSEAELGQFRSAGCVRQRWDKARLLYEWAPIGTPVIVTA